MSTNDESCLEFDLAVFGGLDCQNESPWEDVTIVREFFTENYFEGSSIENAPYFLLDCRRYLLNFGARVGLE